MTKAERELLIYIAKTVRDQHISGVPSLVPWQQRDITRLLRTIKGESSDDC